MLCKSLNMCVTNEHDLRFLFTSFRYESIVLQSTRCHNRYFTRYNKHSNYSVYLHTFLVCNWILQFMLSIYSFELYILHSWPDCGFARQLLVHCVPCWSTTDRHDTRSVCFCITFTIWLLWVTSTLKMNKLNKIHTK